MLVAIQEYILQYRLEIAVVYCLSLIGCWRMIAIHRPYFSQVKDFSLALLPLVNLLAVCRIVKQDICKDMRRDVPSYL